jgi:hypothetical protein
MAAWLGPFSALSLFSLSAVWRERESGGDGRWMVAMTVDGCRHLCVIALLRKRRPRKEEVVVVVFPLSPLLLLLQLLLLLLLSSSTVHITLLSYRCGADFYLICKKTTSVPMSPLQPPGWSMR